MRSGELARLTGLSPDTLRHYERLGLLRRPVRTGSNYRAYDAAALGRVQMIQRALRVGFSLRELSEILAQRDSGRAPCRRVADLLEAKIQQVEEQLHDLAALRSELRSLRRQWKARLQRTPPGSQAHLLDAIPASRARRDSRAKTGSGVRPQNFKSRRGK